MNVNEIINKCAEKNIQLWVKDGNYILKVRKVHLEMN